MKNTTIGILGAGVLLLTLGLYNSQLDKEAATNAYRTEHALRLHQVDSLTDELEIYRDFAERSEAEISLWGQLYDAMKAHDPVYAKRLETSFGLEERLESLPQE